MSAWMTMGGAPHIRWAFLHENVEEAIQPLALFLDRQDLAVSAEDSGKVALDEEAIIMMAMDRPVATPSLAGIVFKPGAEDRQMKVSARLHKVQHTVEIGRPVGLPDVMEYPAIHQRVKAARLEGRRKGIANQERNPSGKMLVTCPLRDRPEGRGQIIETDGKESGLGEEERMSSLTATQVEYPTTAPASLQQMRHAADSRRRSGRRPRCLLPGPVDLRKEASLLSV